MIRIHGNAANVSEWAAANLLREVLFRDAPHLETSPYVSFNIIVSAQTPGQRTRVSDIDLVVMAAFERPYVERYALPALQERGAREVALHSLALTIEVKSHDPSGIRIEGTSVLVNYRGAYHDATNQSLRQRESLREYLRRNVASVPYIVNLLWLTGVTSEQVEALKLPRPNNVLGSDFSFHKLLETVYNLNLPRHDASGGAQYAAFPSRAVDAHAVITLLTKTIECTSLDRKKTEQLINRALTVSWADDLMKRQVVVQGRGGSGKTLALLRSALVKYHDGYRSLVLTYNLALVADLRRQMAILGISEGLASRSIRIQTAHSFFMRLMTAFLDLDPSDVDDEWFGEAYSSKLVELKEYLQHEVIGRDEARSIVAANGDEFDWDLICIDEGQDWLDEERDILRELYGAKRLVVADGRDQLIRRSRRCDWLSELSEGGLKVLDLSQCLRMKANLVAFVNEFASRLGIIGWSLNAENSVPGGKIIISREPALSATVQEQLIRDNSIAGNKPIDMLYCVSANVNSDRNDSSRRLPLSLVEWGYDVWNGLDREERYTFPLSTELCRVVHIESSRGLEGWITVVDGLDSFFLNKVESLEKGLAADGHAMGGDEAKQLALLWCLIPMTRAMDTLFIRIDDEHSEVGHALLELADSFPDFATVI